MYYSIWALFKGAIWIIWDYNFVMKNLEAVKLFWVNYITICKILKCWLFLFLIFRKMLKQC